MKGFLDKFSSSIKVASDILFVKHPLQTSMGVLLGVGLHGLNSIFGNTLESLTQLKFSTLKAWHFIAVGIFGFNVKFLLNQKKLDPEIEEALTTITKMEMNGQIRRDHATLLYKQLAEKVIKNVTLDAELKEKEEWIKSIINISR
jgi:hypothetical protein